MSRPRPPTVVTAVLVLALALSGCARHQIGPARTFDDYARKARTTIESAVSSLETLLLLADVASDGDAFAAYVNVSISAQEDSLDGLASGFRSIQPPDEEADRVSATLDGLLADALGHVVDVRIHARRGELDGLDAIARPLQGDADALRELLGALSRGTR